MAAPVQPGWLPWSVSARGSGLLGGMAVPTQGDRLEGTSPGTCAMSASVCTDFSNNILRKYSLLDLTHAPASPLDAVRRLLEVEFRCHQAQ